MEQLWNSLCVPSGEWFWWKPLPNGWTAWVVDDSFRRGARTEYAIYASSGEMKRAVKFKCMKLAPAKSLALSLALAQPPRVCRTERIEVDASTDESN